MNILELMKESGKLMAGCHRAEISVKGRSDFAIDVDMAVYFQREINWSKAPQKG